MNSILKFFFIGIIFVSKLAFAVDASEVKIAVTLTPLGDFVAQTDKVSGYAIENPDGSILAKDISVDLASLKTGITLRDTHMKDKYLEVKKYPKAILKIGNGKNGRGEGELKIHGKEIKISGTYKKIGSLLTAEFNLNLEQIGITDVKYKGVGVDNEVKINVKVNLKKGVKP